MDGLSRSPISRTFRKQVHPKAQFPWRRIFVTPSLVLLLVGLDDRTHTSRHLGTDPDITRSICPSQVSRIASSTGSLNFSHRSSDLILFSFAKAFFEHGLWLLLPMLYQVVILFVRFGEFPYTLF